MDGHSPCPTGRQAGRDPAGTGVGAASTSLLHGDPAATAGIHSPRALLRSLSLSSVIRDRLSSLMVLQGFLKVHRAKYMHFRLDRRGQRTHRAGLR